MGTTAELNLRWPNQGDPVDVSLDMRELAEDVELNTKFRLFDSSGTRDGTWAAPGAGAVARVGNQAKPLSGGFAAHGFAAYNATTGVWDTFLGITNGDVHLIGADDGSGKITIEGANVFLNPDGDLTLAGALSLDNAVPGGDGSITSPNWSIGNQGNADLARITLDGAVPGGDGSITSPNWEIGSLGGANLDRIALDGAVGGVPGSIISPNWSVTAAGVATLDQVDIPGIAAAGGGATNVQISAGRRLVEVTSLAQYKDDVRPVSDDERAALHDLRPITFRSNLDADDNDRRFFGLIAEEVETASEPLAVYDADGNIRAVDYARLSVQLLAEVQQLRKDVEAMR